MVKKIVRANRLLKGGANKFYSIETKKKIVDLVLSGKESVISISRRFGIGGKLTVYRWSELFQDGRLIVPQTSNFSCSEIMATSKFNKKSKNKASFQKEIEPASNHLRFSHLPPEKELEILRLQRLAYETMIDVAENELGISIKKKS